MNRPTSSTYADFLRDLEDAVFDAVGPNVGPEEFDDAASRAVKARRGMLANTCMLMSDGAKERRDRILSEASRVFGNYI